MTMFLSVLIESHWVGLVPCSDLKIWYQKFPKVPR